MLFFSGQNAPPCGAAAFMAFLAKGGKGGSRRLSAARIRSIRPPCPPPCPLPCPPPCPLPCRPPCARPCPSPSPHCQPPCWPPCGKSRHAPIGTAHGFRRAIIMISAMRRQAGALCDAERCAGRADGARRGGGDRGGDWIAAALLPAGRRTPATGKERTGRRVTPPARSAGPREGKNAAGNIMMRIGQPLGSRIEPGFGSPGREKNPPARARFRARRR